MSDWRERDVRWWLWSAAVALALLIHFLGLLTRPLWFGSIPRMARERMPVETVSADQLQSLRKKWKMPSVRTDPLPRSESAAENARYISDRNVRVEKEQRARRGNEGGAKTSSPSVPTLPVPPKSNYRIERARLGNLGVPYKFTMKPPPAAAEKAAPQISRPPGRFEGDGAQQQLRENLPEGSMNFLNTQESVYYSFFERMREAIQPNWVRVVREAAAPILKNLSPGDYYTVLEITLDRDGNVLETALMKSSGVGAIDEAAKASFWRVKRIPNPPQGIREPDGRVRFPVGFSFMIGPDAGLQYNYYDPWNYR